MCIFQLSSAGHEAISVATAVVLRPDCDWLFPHVRDRALCLYLGMTPYDQLLGAVAAHTDENSGSRQMPSHWGLKRLNMPSRSSCIGMQFLHAVGVAEAGYRRSLLAKEKLLVTYDADEIVYAGSGEGGTSEGEFWESINTACNLRPPVLYVIQDNEYAISVPVEVQTAGGSISSLLRGFPNLYVEECDGTDVAESYEAVERAATHCRDRHGPALLHAHVIRPYSHSMSDDESLYRSPEELEDEARRDPIRKLEARLIASGHLTSDEVKNIHTEVDAEIDQAAELALAVPHAAGETAMDYVYSPDVDPTSKHFDTEGDLLARARKERWQSRSISVLPMRWSTTPISS